MIVMHLNENNNKYDIRINCSTDAESNLNHIFKLREKRKILMNRNFFEWKNVISIYNKNKMTNTKMRPEMNALNFEW